MSQVRFDDSLPLLAQVVRAELGADALLQGSVLRDATGRLAFFAGTPISDNMIATLSSKIRDALGPYARSDRVVASPDEDGAKAIRESPSALIVRIGSGPDRVRLIDRRFVGVDWLRAPLPLAPPPARIVFASIKGGVGRSTALAVAAAHLASNGARVLAVDLDMEAPGLGAMLLNRDTLPRYGMVDALVENSLSGLDESFCADLIGPSALADRGGRIDVLPAIGMRSLDNPADVLAKIARAYLENIDSDGKVATLLDQIRDVIDRFATPARYDAILVDARAGLHETLASSVLGLGAEVLLFGLDEPQTFQGYSLLLAHLARFLDPGCPVPEWAERLTMVQGKAPVDSALRSDFAARCRELFAISGFGPTPPPAAAGVPLPASPFNDVPWDDETADDEALSSEWMQSEPLAILNDAHYHEFDPHRRRDLLAESAYRGTFGDLLDRIDALTKLARRAS